MSDFHDFLKRQYAYVAIGEFKPGKFEEAKNLYEQAVATYTKEGFDGAYLLQEPGTDKGIAIIFWESAADMEANKSDAHQALLEKMGHLFVKPPITNFNEVVSEIEPKALSMV
ncbi:MULTISPECIES: antibiotic biosynthesis monooxygenase [Planktothricoides]|uniref:Antibiotic biosynthesis monooxygenase n=2 Tax=Planktothricoides raciborskii TaxID=132608 RepID=A0AAU8JJM2_9CYAN|nr:MULTISPECIES: antibiotic biosynthesis monooxygenase [Planktothricoides]KOR34300.1 antibiotic biosynthesis monooxygenase [Planktothricoides sp. SR001]MBD2547250.1 antibiotic biosynthesis monooxygenase [Planktothricoides raciborskii FACHB-1370]MBD2585752.1 antibiotic biosynthesis monooxygenase [Planktothricoides raciborskii FACHB-1261]